MKVAAAAAMDVLIEIWDVGKHRNERQALKASARWRQPPHEQRINMYLVASIFPGPSDTGVQVFLVPDECHDAQASVHPSASWAGQAELGATKYDGNTAAERGDTWGCSRKTARVTWRTIEREPKQGLPDRSHRSSPGEQLTGGAVVHASRLQLAQTCLY